MQIDANGNECWRNVYPIALSSTATQVATRGYDVIYNAALNEYDVVGSAKSGNATAGLNTYVVRINTLGGLLCSRVINEAGGGNSWGRSIAMANDNATTGNVVIAGANFTNNTSYLMELGFNSPDAASCITSLWTREYAPQTTANNLTVTGLSGGHIPECIMQPLFSSAANGGYTLSSNNSNGPIGAYDGHLLRTDGGGKTPDECPSQERSSPLSVMGSIAGLNESQQTIGQWTTLETFSNEVDLTTIGCETTTDPCEVTSNFCYEINGNAVAFTNTSTGNGSLAYVWNFGDGSLSTATNPTKTYPNPGNYTVCLQVTNTLPNGETCQTNCCRTITINAPCPTLPDPKFSYTIGNNGTSTTFTNNTGPSSTSFTFKWIVDGVASNTPPTSLTPGTHTVCLDVSKNNCSKRVCRTIVISAPCAFIPATFKHSTCLNSNAVTFSGTAPVSSVMPTYTWDFGDGTSGDGFTTTHTYADFGTYVACLTVTNGSCITRTCQTVKVTQSLCSVILPDNMVAEDEENVANEDASAYRTATNDVWNVGNDLQILPNPATSEVQAVFSQLATASGVLLLSDTRGRLVQQFSLVEGAREQRIDLSSLPPGLYLLTLQRSDGSISQAKIVKH